MFQRSFSDARLVGIHRYRYIQLALQPLQYGNQAMQFLFFSEAFRARAGAFRADVDNVRALFLKFQSPGSGGVRLRILPSVTKRVRCNIQNPNQHRPRTEFEGLTAEIPDLSYAIHSYRRQTIGSRLAALFAG